jgi:hypothetical protein
MIHDNILIGINSHEIFRGKKFMELVYDFTNEYHSKGFADIYWGTNETLTQDNLEMLEDTVKPPIKKVARKIEKESFKESPIQRRKAAKA